MMHVVTYIISQKLHVDSNSCGGYPSFDWHALDLLERMLTLDPLQVCPVSDLQEFLRKQPSM
jgi:hypothetical protein